MRKAGLLFFLTVLTAPFMFARADAAAKTALWVKAPNDFAAILFRVKSKCIKVQGKRVCFEDDDGDQDDDDDEPKKKKRKGGDQTSGERSCPPGYVVLEKPNKYGASCELVPKTPPVEWTSFSRELRGTNTDAVIAPFRAECANYKAGYIGCREGSPPKAGSVHVICQCSYQK